jgi:hypothetical protein
MPEPTSPDDSRPTSSPVGPPPGPGATEPTSAPLWAARPLGRVKLIAVVVTVVVVGVTLAVVAFTGGGKTPAPSAAGTGPAAPTSAAGPSGSPVSPDLIGFDDFTGTAPDKRWGLYNSTSPIGGIWSPAMDQVGDGVLRIVGKGNNPTGQGNQSGGLCWCGTGGNRLYGRWEVRARFDAGAGYGATIGLWPQSDVAADGSVTFAQSRDPDKHMLRTYVVWSDGHLRSNEIVSKGDYTTWHTYSVEWRATFVRITVDGTVVYDSTTSTQKVVIPQQPMHLILQQMVGPRDGVPAADASTPAEVDMTVDWVKMYR